MVKIKKKFSRGFSFAEAIISVAIFVFMLLAVVYVYNSYTKVYNYQETVTYLASSARAGANELQNTALQADHIVASHVFSGTTYSTDGDTLVLEIPSIDGSGDIINGKYDFAVFYLTGNNFYKKVQVDASSARSSGTRQLSNAVQAIAFTYDNANLALASKITTTLQMQKTTRKQVVSYNLEQEIFLRNF